MVVGPAASTKRTRGKNLLENPFFACCRASPTPGTPRTPRNWMTDPNGITLWIDFLDDCTFETPCFLPPRRDVPLGHFLSPNLRHTTSTASSFRAQVQLDEHSGRTKRRRKLLKEVFRVLGFNQAVVCGTSECKKGVIHKIRDTPGLPPF